MNILNMGLTKLANGTGNITKAVLVIKNPIEMRYLIEEKKEQTKNSFGENKGSVSEADIMARTMQMAGLARTDLEHDSNSMVESIMNAAKDLLGSRNASGTGFGLNANADGLSFYELKKRCGTAAKEMHYLFLEVMYNPASISITSEVGKSSNYDRGGTLGSASSTSLSERNVPFQRRMTFKIIIDDENNSDAFSTTLNTSLTVSNVADMVASVKKDYSVKSKCEALMGLVNYEFLRDVIFCYGKMIFHGELTDCGVKYTMFNRVGNPVRAEVQLTILQTSSKDSMDHIYWENAYNKFVQQVAR